MAIEALINFGKPFKHEPRHDLESLLYVILYMCTYTTGPGIMRKVANVLAITIPLGRWFKKEYVKEIGRSKIGHMGTFEDAIISKFDEYWADFVPFVRDLIKACFPLTPTEANCLTHSNMLTILTVARDKVSEPPSSNPTPIGGPKRRLGSSGIQPAKKGKHTLRTLRV
jgi:hypothetical protein